MSRSTKRIARGRAEILAALARLERADRRRLPDGEQPADGPAGSIGRLGPVERVLDRSQGRREKA